MLRRQHDARARACVSVSVTIKAARWCGQQHVIMLSGMFTGAHVRTCASVTHQSALERENSPQERTGFCLNHTERVPAPHLDG